jgi:hypothetical protein
VEQKDKRGKVSLFGMGVKTPMNECNGSGVTAETAIQGNRRSNIFLFKLERNANTFCLRDSDFEIERTIHNFTLSIN